VGHSLGILNLIDGRPLNVGSADHQILRVGVQEVGVVHIGHSLMLRLTLVSSEVLARGASASDSGYFMVEVMFGGFHHSSVSQM
jgi:hypothetical protein